MLSVTDRLLTQEKHLVELWQETNSTIAPLLMIIAGFHGDEKEGVWLLHRFIQRYQSAQVKTGPFRLCIIPCLNPDGMERGTRENASGVDLNRNYPTRNFKPVSFNPHSGFARSGTPASELETQWLMHQIETLKPERILSIHSDLALVDYDGPEAGRKWAEEVSRLSGYKCVKTVGYETPGSFGTWAGVEKGIPLVTLETHKAVTQEALQMLEERLDPLFNSLI